MMRVIQRIGSPIDKLKFEKEIGTRKFGLGEARAVVESILPNRNDRGRDTNRVETSAAVEGGLSDGCYRRRNLDVLQNRASVEAVIDNTFD